MLKWMHTHDPRSITDVIANYAAAGGLIFLAVYGMWLIEAHHNNESARPLLIIVLIGQNIFFYSGVFIWIWNLVKSSIDYYNYVKNTSISCGLPYRYKAASRIIIYITLSLFMSFYAFVITALQMTPPNGVK